MKPIIFMQQIILFLLLTSITACSYLPEPLPKDTDFILEENADYISLTTTSSDQNKAGILFYPGGLVDPHSYIPALKALAVADNRTVVILKVASNLAILNAQKASKVIEEMSDIDQWVLGGHSLGGAVACINAFNQPDDFDGLFLLAAYSINDLSNSNLPILSITASNDVVLDQERFTENNSNLPEGLNINTADDIPEEGTTGTTLYYEIEGGNHAQFGNYGTQKGDGEASIDAATQQGLVIDVLRRFLDSNNL